MEHILISPGKLKLMLTREDVIRYDLKPVIESGEEPDSKQTFKALLDDAGDLGFDPGNDRLFIQLYPSKDGGAEVYITRLGEHIRGGSGELPVTYIVCFDSLDDLLACCKRLSFLGGESSAWYEEMPKRWFLVVSETVTWHDYLERGLGVEAIIGEYGRNIKSQGAIYYIKEHCFNFCEKRAVKILESMI